MREEKSPRFFATAGFIIGAVLGQAGGIVGPGPAQNVCWAVSSVGLIAGSMLFAMMHARASRELVAAGFGLLALGEGLMWAGGNPGEAGQVAAFASGVLFYVPALLLISVPRGLPLVTRILGIATALPWSVYSLEYLTRSNPSTSSPLVIAGYVGLSASSIAWAIAARKHEPLGRTVAGVGRLAAECDAAGIEDEARV